MQCCHQHIPLLPQHSHLPLKPLPLPSRLLQQPSMHIGRTLGPHHPLPLKTGDVRLSSGQLGLTGGQLCFEAGCMGARSQRGFTRRGDLS